MQKNKNKKDPNEMAFLDHVGELRKHILKSLVGIVIGGVIMGVFWPFFQRLIMAPLSSDFITYRAFNALGQLIGAGDIFQSEFDVQEKLTNLEFGGQFTAIVGVILVGGLVLSLPYVVYELFQFLKPGLTMKELKYSNFIMLFTILFFLTGVAFAYFLIMPLSVHFMYFFQPFGVENNWKLISYINTFVQTLLAMGLVFLLPIIVYFLAKIGLITPEFMIKYRKHAVVVIMTLAAAITPADLMSMFVASIPLLLLYEFSLWVVKFTAKRDKIYQEKTTSVMKN
ncbi:twin-arginine translocase subunit TatC [Candidatus Ornithobacterium hominis]|uniref:twin-arginine translocase subunit TatC n=1 Tax=Candidatus Ornithobacterium hominis TaxID=2497989 RepID=UPI0024BBF370|nr:twin-arginine translocase subunit TatC [Candidatus Ornithobacterium hominis]CAI9429429.1 twin-arginine translocase subunit TatC [Candidatus Ornithobacterium hominis]